MYTITGKIEQILRFLITQYQILVLNFKLVNIISTTLLLFVFDKNF